MKRFVLFLFMVCSTFGLFSEIRYEQKDNVCECIITYKNDNLEAVNIIGSMTDDWTEPGVPMVKNADGVWEYRFKMTRSREFYKFYNPATEGETAYIEDPEALETIDSPIGGKNAVAKRPPRKVKRVVTVVEEVVE